MFIKLKGVQNSFYCYQNVFILQFIASQIEDQMLDPILTISVVDGDPSVAPEPYAFLHLDLTYLPRGQPKEEWSVMEMIPGYVEPPPPTPVRVSVSF